MRHVGLVLSAVLFVLVAMHCGTCACIAACPSVGEGAELRAIERRIDDGEQKRMRAMFPEGGLFTLSFTGFAIANLAVEHPDADAPAEIAKLLALSEAERDVEPFRSWGTRAGRWRGVILEGHQNLLRAAYVVVGGTDDKIVADFHATSKRLADMFEHAPSGALESFWGRTWYVDNAVALESLRMHDALYGTTIGATSMARFRAGLQAHVDKRSGMPASEVSLDGAHVKDGPRGCALSWLLAFQPDEYYQRYRRDWTVNVLGMTGFREYPPWRNGAMDVDSGPIVDGIGAAASAFGVAAARANGDDHTLAEAELPLTILTAPAITLHGDVELFAGQLVLADVLSLWARTITPWDEATRTSRPTTTPSTPPLFAFAVVETFTLGPTLLAGLVFWRSLRRWRRSTTTTATTTAASR